jgi:outer membrane protein assembly factor BamA
VQAFAGEDVLALNAEFRSESIEVLGAHLGGVLFYDSGLAAESLGGRGLQHSLGAGVRLLFPQFDRIPLRLDWGFPVGSSYATLPGAFYLTFGQAFEFPAVSSPTVLNGFLPD